MTRSLLAPFALMATTALAIAQAPDSSTAHTSDALDLLTQVAAHYANASSYYIDSTEEQTLTGDYERTWTKKVLTASEAPGGKLYFEGHSNVGSAIKASDGTTVWEYQVDQHRYTAKPVSGANDSKPHPIAMSEMASTEAANLRKMLAHIGQEFKSGERLPDEQLIANGQPVLCHRVHVQSSDLKRAIPGYSFDRTIWIDAEHDLILKIVEHASNFMMAGSARLPIKLESTASFSNTVLDGPARGDLFTFKPPSDARLVAEFPNPIEDGFSGMAGDPIPPLKFRSADGKITTIESFRGKPVLLDFWATWCAPCVASLPALAEIYKEARDKGLALISIDEDEEAAKASNLLAKKGYDWPNFHDGDGTIQKTMGSSSGLPRIVLIDAQGQIVFDGAGDEAAIRRHIAKLGPEFADLAPKPKPAPCTIAVQSK